MSATSKTDEDIVRIGGIHHRIRKPSKAIEMLRLERELQPVLDRWREAVRRKPEDWK